MNYRRLIQLYKHFPFKTATALTLCEASRAWVAPDGRCSYAQTGEDIIIASYVDPNCVGFYVDVGCHHPIRGSNTLSLYSRGWRGVVVDGNRELIEIFKCVRPRDTAICAIVSNEERPITFTLANQPNLSTVSPDFERVWIGESGVKERVEVNAITLQTIMVENKVPSTFDLLSIDVEGHDYEVLTSFNIDAFRPRVIVIEMHGFMPARGSNDRIYKYLEQNQYELKSYSVMNGLFVDSRSGTKDQ
jgi:FkbM family methyltransferase